MTSLTSLVANRWLLRFAKYSPDFLQWVGQQRFKNPESKERVLFQSLPTEEQVKIHGRWEQMRQDRGRQQEENRWLEGNQDPKRYEHVDFQIRLDEHTAKEDQKRLSQIFHTEDQNKMRDHILDLAGAGGFARIVDSVDVITWKEEDETVVRVMGRGKHAVHFEREIIFDSMDDDHSPSRIRNKFFAVAKDAPPGVGTRMLASQVGAASQWGFSHIETEATRGDTMNGYYTWPRLGFNADIADDVLDALEEYDPKAAEEVQALAQKDGNRLRTFEGTVDFNNAQVELFHVMAIPAAQKWWEEYGDSISSVFPLSASIDGGKSYNLLKAYTEVKAMAEGQTIPEYLSKIGAKINMGPQFTKQDDEILDRVWAEARKRLEMTRGKNQATRITGAWFRAQIVKTSI